MMLTSSLLLMLTTTFVVHDVISHALGDNVTSAIVDEDAVCSLNRCAFNETFSLLDCADRSCTSWRVDNSTAIGGGGGGTGSINDNQLRSWLTAAHLSLRGNRLRSLASLQPFGATLRTVDASLNEISSIEADAFFLSDGLAELNLSSNRLEISAFRSPNSMTLFGLTALRRLDLSSNNFTELSEPDMLISTRTTLTELDLSNNVIMRIADDALADLSALESLDLSRNRIQSLTSQNFLGLVWLQRIDLSDNRLDSLPDGLFAQCHRLRLLDLRRNAILHISAEAFHGLDSLIDLLLDDNKLPEGVPAILPPSLRSLSLDGSTELVAITNRTFVVDTRVGRSPPSLELLSIRRCPLLVGVGPGAFGMFKRFTVVQLTNNRKLTSVDDRAFEEDDNTIDVWIGDAAVKRHAPVTLLNFSGNALNSLSELLVNWKDVKAFDLSGNAWSCDCHLDWMHRIDADNASLQTVVCHWPLHLRGNRFTSDTVRTTTLSCNLSFVHRFEGGIGLIAGLTVLFVATAVALAVRCRHTLVPGLFDTDSEYRTIYDASESTVSLNRVDASDGGGAADVGESSPTEDGLETDDDEPTTGAADSTLAAKRPLVARSVRGSATGSAKKRNKTVDA